MCRNWIGFSDVWLVAGGYTLSTTMWAAFFGIKLLLSFTLAAYWSGFNEISSDSSSESHSLNSA